jgi:adenylate cyclase
MEACGPILRIDSQMDVMPKGVKESIRIYEVGGIGGDFNIFLPEKKYIELIELQQPLPIKFTILDGKHASEEAHDGNIVKLTDTVAEIQAQGNCCELTNLKIALFNDKENEITPDLYAKVTEILPKPLPTFRVYFTSVPPEAKTFFEKVLVPEKQGRKR